MSHTHDIDNDDLFLLLHSYEPPTRLAGGVREPQPGSSASRTPLSSTPTPGSPPWYCNQFPLSPEDMAESPTNSSKGKDVSRPLDTHAREATDIFLDLGLGSPTGKGKGKAPVLPPLVFDPTSLEYANADWASFDAPAYVSMPVSASPQTAGPSSYGSGFASMSAESAHSINHDDVTPPASPEASPPLEHVPARRPRSLSGLSVRSTRSLSALSVSKVKVKLAGTRMPGNVARKLLFRKRDDGVHPATPPSSPDTGAVVDTEVHANIQLGRGSCFMPWARELKSCTSPPQGTLVDIDVGLSSGLASPISPISPIYRMAPAAGSTTLRAKGRSYSSPFPLPSSPFDIVPAAPAEISEPIPVEVPNYFDCYLPRELRLRVLATLVDLHEADHERAIASGKWSALRAGSSRNRWVGREKGIRELLKLSRVGTRPSQQERQCM